MELSHHFEIVRPIDEAWAVLTDIERVAPCIPGAQLQEVEGADYRGIVRVRLGPITTEYAGTATVVEQNDTDYKLTLSGQGLDAADNGDAAATLTVKLEPVSDHSTRVNIDTDLTITGRVAQLSKGVIPDVSEALIEQFAENLAELLDDGGVAEQRITAHGGKRRTVDMPEPEAIDLMESAGTPVLKRVAAIVIAVLFIRWLVRR